MSDKSKELQDLMRGAGLPEDLIQEAAKDYEKDLARGVVHLVMDHSTGKELLLVDDDKDSYRLFSSLPFHDETEQVALLNTLILLHITMTTLSRLLVEAPMELLQHMRRDGLSAQEVVAQTMHTLMTTKGEEAGLVFTNKNDAMRKAA